MIVGQERILCSFTPAPFTPKSRLSEHSCSDNRLFGPDSAVLEGRIHLFEQSAVLSPIHGSVLGSRYDPKVLSCALEYRDGVSHFKELLGFDQYQLPSLRDEPFWAIQFFTQNFLSLFEIKIASSLCLIRLNSLNTTALSLSRYSSRFCKIQVSLTQLFSKTYRKSIISKERSLIRITLNKVIYYIIIHSFSADRSIMYEGFEKK